MVLVTLVIGSLVGQSAIGDPASKIAQKQDELDRIQSTEGPLRAQIDQMNAEVDRLIGEESQLRQAQAAAQHELEVKQAELDQATAELNAEKAELARVRAKLKEAVGALEQLLVDIYKSNEPDLTAVVMRSANWSDLLTRTEYINHIQEYDDQVVASGPRAARPDQGPGQPAPGDPRPHPGCARPGRRQGAADRESARADLSNSNRGWSPPGTRARESSTPCSARSARFRRTSPRSRRRPATRRSTPAGTR